MIEVRLCVRRRRKVRISISHSVSHSARIGLHSLEFKCTGVCDQEEIPLPPPIPETFLLNPWIPFLAGLPILPIKALPISVLLPPSKFFFVTPIVPTLIRVLFFSSLTSSAPSNLNTLSCCSSLLPEGDILGDSDLPSARLFTCAFSPQRLVFLFPHIGARRDQ